jgi:hypothetical protein
MKETDVRRLGVLVALAICALVTAAGLLIVPPEGAAIGLLGVPGSTILAWRIAPTVAASNRWRAMGMGTFVAGLGAIVIGDVIVSAVLAAGAAVQPAGGLDGAPIAAVLAIPVAYVGAFVGLAVLGALFGGPVAALLTVPCGIAWALLVRWLAVTAGGPPAQVARRRRGGRAWLIGFAAGLIVGVAMTLLGTIGFVLGIGLVLAAAADRSRLTALGGVLLALPLGAGLLLWRASAACAPPSCGAPDLSVWVVAMAVSLVGGALLSTIGLALGAPTESDQGGDAPSAA